MEVTVEKRHEIYVLALKKYTELITHTDVRVGLCGLIYYISGYEYDCDINQFPEIYKHKPKKKTDNDYWWNVNNTKKRIQVLEGAIKETES